MRTRRSLIHADCVAVLASLRLMAQTIIQLFELNQRIILQWFDQREKQWERTVLEQGVLSSLLQLPLNNHCFPQRSRPWSRWGKGSPLNPTSLRSNPPPTDFLLPLLLLLQRTGGGRRLTPAPTKRRQLKRYVCSSCGQLQRLDTGHFRIGGVSSCASAGGTRVETGCLVFSLIFSQSVEG